MFKLHDVCPLCSGKVVLGYPDDHCSNCSWKYCWTEEGKDTNSQSRIEAGLLWFVLIILLGLVYILYQF